MDCLHRLIFVSCFSTMLLLPACGSDKSQFGGTVEAKSTVKSENSQDTNVNSEASSSKPAVQTPAVCKPGEVGITQARLTSKGLSRRQIKQSLVYELSVISCKDGSRLVLTNQEVAFDLKAVIGTGFGMAAPYVLSDAANSKVLNSGMFDTIEGRDLFGNFGNFAHWTTKSFTYSSDVGKLVLEIPLDQFQIEPFNVGDTYIDTYLKVGQTQAITTRVPYLD